MKISLNWFDSSDLIRTDLRGLACTDFKANYQYNIYPILSYFTINKYSTVEVSGSSESTENSINKKMIQLKKKKMCWSFICFTESLKFIKSKLFFFIIY